MERAENGVDYGLRCLQSYFSRWGAPTKVCRFTRAVESVVLARLRNTEKETVSSVLRKGDRVFRVRLKAGGRRDGKGSLISG